MYCFHSLAWSLTCLLPLQARGSNVQGSTIAATASLQASSTANPICLQSRTSTDPVAAAIQSSITSDNSINKACDPSTQQIRVIPWTHTFYALDSYYFFNSSLQELPSISTPTSTPTSYPDSQNCILNFNAIFSSCVSSQNFWGGWIESNGLNYSSKCSKQQCSDATDIVLGSPLHSAGHGLYISTQYFLVGGHEI